jgi:hypothetical protein
LRRIELDGREERAMAEDEAGEAIVTGEGGVSDPAPSEKGEAVLICPKCEAENPPTLDHCEQCGAALLPGWTIRDRLGLIGTGIVGAAILVGLGYLMNTVEGVPDCCISPEQLLCMATFGLVASFAAAVRRTPEFEQYQKRALRHVEASPEQALADFAKALDTAPPKRHAEILKQRYELLAKLGRKEEAVADLAAYASHEEAHRGSKLLGDFVGVDLQQAAGVGTQQELAGLQKELVQEGALVGVGYCKHCKDAVQLDEQGRCVLCGGEVKKPRLVKPEEADAERTRIRGEKASKRRSRIALAIVAVVVLVGCGLCVGWIEWMNRLRPEDEEAQMTLVATAAPTSFEEDIFAFEYPSDWEQITEDEVDELLKTSLKGLTPDAYSYIGGVYTGGIGDCEGCAQIVLIAMKDPSLTGTLTDEEYQRVREAAEDKMGARLLDHHKAEICSLPAAESVHLGASGDTKLRDVIVVPPEPGVAYMVSCCAQEDSYDAFEAVFDRALATFQVMLPTPEPSPAAEPTADIEGCALGAVFQADVTIPDNTEFAPGEAFTKTWRVRNTGTCAWGPGYRVTFVGSDQMGGPDSAGVAVTEPGEEAEISVGLVAPEEPGRFRGDWQLCVNEEECFGDKLYVQIISGE